MLKFKSGYELEDAIFGCHSSGGSLVERFAGQRPDFDKDVKRLIRQSSHQKYPGTQIGRSIFHYAKEELEKLGVNCKGFVFLTAINTKVDLKHFADGIFYLPSVLRFPVTVDTFNIDTKELLELRDSWIDKFEGRVYSDSDFQTDLFRYKAGVSTWRKEALVAASEGHEIFPPTDFREYTDYGRPENHFVLTPFHLTTYRQRRKFAKMLARYLASKAVAEHAAVKQKCHHKPALSGR
jgi:hypothetical protein